MAYYKVKIMFSGTAAQNCLSTTRVCTHTHSSSRDIWRHLLLGIVANPIPTWTNKASHRCVCALGPLAGRSGLGRKSGTEKARVPTFILERLRMSSGRGIGLLPARVCRGGVGFVVARGCAAGCGFASFCAVLSPPGSG